jgi:hypothetical protein
MRVAFSLVVFVLLSTVQGALASDVEQLASCTTKVFNVIARTQKWTGKAPAGCDGRVSVRKEGDGVAVAVSRLIRENEGWERISFATSESFQEIARPKSLAAANRDIMARAKKLARCLDTLGTDKFPASCTSRGTKNLVVDEESGEIEVTELVLNDAGRPVMVQYQVGDTIATPTEPAEDPANNALPQGMDLHIFVDGGRTPGK